MEVNQVKINVHATVCVCPFYNQRFPINTCIFIIESVDSISRDGLDTPIIIYNTLQNA